MYKLHCLQSAAGSEDLSLEKITACSKSTKLGKYFKDCVEAAAESPHLSADKITACGKNAVGPSLSQCYEIAGEKSTSLETVRKCKTRLPLSQKYISCLHGKSSRAEHGNAEEEEDEFAPAGATGAQ